MLSIPVQQSNFTLLAPQSPLAILCWTWWSNGYEMFMGGMNWWLRQWYPSPIPWQLQHPLHGVCDCAINALGVKVIIIPPGCTLLMKPVNIGYNKPFKRLIRNKYQQWMIHSSEDLSKPPCCVNIAHWVVAAKCEMNQSTMVNACMRHDLEYFPCTSLEVDVPLVVNVPMG